MYPSPHMVNWNYARISDSPTFPRSLLSIRCKRSSRFWIFNREKRGKVWKRRERIRRVEKRREKTTRLWTFSIPRGWGEISRIFSRNNLIVWSMKIKIAAHPSSLAAEGPLQKSRYNPQQAGVVGRKEMTRTDPRSFFPSPPVDDESMILIYCSPL